MSSSTAKNVLPFDPREVGPVDVARAWYRRTQAFGSNHVRELLAFAAVIIVASWVLKINLIPNLPNWVLISWIVLGFAAPPGVITGWATARELYRPDSVLLSIQSPTNGDQKLVWIAPERFDSMRVVNHNGANRERDYLHETRVNGIKAYEVDSYYRAGNVAVASWQAGVSNSDIRQDRKAIKRIRTTLEEEADKAIEVLINNPSLLRSMLKEAGYDMVRISEGVEVPDGQRLHKRFTDIVEEEDVSEELLDGDTDASDSSRSGSDSDDDRVDEDGMDIFDRAREIAKGNGSAEVPADD